MEEAVVIDFCGGLRGEEVLLESLEVMLNFWEETRKRRKQSHLMANLKGK